MRRAVFALTIALSATLAAPSTAQEVKRDPNGVKGISPYMEDIAKARDAFKGGDLPGALTNIDAAIGKDDGRTLGWLLKSQVQLSSGNLDTAIATADAANGKLGTEEEQSKLAFLIADLKERKADTPAGEDNADGTLKAALQSKWDQVKDAWNAYVAYVAEHSRVPDYKASAEDRKQKVDDRVKRDKDYAGVRKRIISSEADALKKK